MRVPIFQNGDMEILIKNISLPIFSSLIDSGQIENILSFTEQSSFSALLNLLTIPEQRSKIKSLYFSFTQKQQENFLRKVIADNGYKEIPQTISSLILEVRSDYDLEFKLDELSKYGQVSLIRKILNSSVQNKVKILCKTLINLSLRGCSSDCYSTMLSYLAHNEFEDMAALVRHCYLQSVSSGNRNLVIELFNTHQMVCIESYKSALMLANFTENTAMTDLLNQLTSSKTKAASEKNHNYV